ncbi:AAA domain-containing protein [Kitasatospora sp. NPDC096147]|uniref:AAA domain-containing protein n=1 Tax=Kitasatospora sp. NPDC096147 TaxID=3364093 RepID=UPI0037F83A64
MVEQRPAPVEDLLTAVRAEIVACRRDAAERAEKVFLHHGRRIAAAEDRFEYLFTCRSWPESMDAKALVVRPAQSKVPWAAAEVSRLPDGTVRVVTSTDLGPSLASALLREDDASTWVALGQRLEAVGSKDSPIDLGMAGLVLGQGSPAMARIPDPARWVAGWHGLQLNPKQRAAVELALGSQVMFLWGPPGTGKTDVVSHIAEGCYRQGLNLLFLAPTNVAVDQALERMCDLLQQEPGFGDGLVQRAGDISVASLEQRYGDRVDPVRIASRVGTALNSQITQLTGLLDSLRSSLALHDEANGLDRELTDTRAQHATATATAQQASAALLNLEAEAATLRVKIAEIGVPTGPLAARKTAKLHELHGRLAGTEHSLTGARAQQNSARVQRDAAASSISDLSGRLAALRPRLSGVPPRPQLAEQADSLQRQLEQLDQQRRALEDTVRSRCRIKGATVTKAVQSRKLLDRVDVVIIDEAGMVNLPSAWYAAGLAGKRLVIAGDFRQLPAITKGGQDREATEPQRQHSRHWAERDAFHAAGLVTDGGTARQDDPRLIGLDTQYRMHSRICAVVNTVAYPDAPLRTGRSDGSRLPTSPLLASPLVLVDTSARRIPGRDHKSNAVHEAVIHQLVRGLQYDGVLPGRNWAEAPEDERPGRRMAVIAPYRDQVRALNASLSYRFGAEYEGVVDTVHRFQGSQRPLVVIDTVAGAGRQLGQFYSGTGLSSQTCRLLNVALSRAQDHLIVVADLEHLRAGLAPHSEAVRMLDHLERHALRLPVDQLVPIRSAADLGVLSQDELAHPAFFPADEVQRAIAWDLQQATKSVEVYCAFLDPQPVRYWARPFRELTDRGVQVTVVTRDHTADPRKAPLVHELRHAGCRVEQRERMHEKVLIVDETVLWHGSLNLLTNTGPTDLMMRITDGLACQRVRRIIDRARPGRPSQSPSTGTRPVPPPASAQLGAASVSAPPAGLPAPGIEVDGRLYLAVPFAEKDDAKREVSARWDKAARLWWTTPDHRTDAARWLPPAP